MSSSFYNIYKKAEQLHIEGFFDEVDTHLAKIEKMKDLGMEEYISSRLLKLKNLIKQKKFDAALVYSQRLEDFCNDNELPISKAFIQLEKLNVYLNQRRYDDIQKIIVELMKFLSKYKKIQDDEILEIKARLEYSKAWALMNRSTYEEAIEKTENSLELYRELGDEYKIGICLRLSATNYFYAGNLEKSLDYFHEALDIFRKRKARLDVSKVYYGIAGIHYKKGELNQALEFTSKSLAILEELDDQFEIGRTIQGMGYIYSNMGKTEKAIEHSRQAKMIFEKLGLKHEVAKCLMDSSGYMRNLGEYDSALSILFSYYKIKQELDDEHCLGIAHDNIGLLYEIKGEFEQAMDHYEKAKAILSRLQIKDSLADVYFNMGQILYRKGDYEKAIELHLTALDLRNQMVGGRSQGILIGDSLKSLVEINLELKNYNIASNYLDELEELSKKVENKKVDLLFKIALSLTYKKSAKKENLHKADVLLDQIINEEIVEHFITVEAILHRIEILIWKLAKEENEEVLKEVNSLIQNLEKIASEKNSYLLLAEAYFLQSQLSIINLDINSAKDFLMKSIYIAEDKGLNRLAIKISNEYDSLLEKLDTWDEFTQKLPTIAEKLELTHIEEQLNKVIKGSIVVDVVEENELPVLILILDRESRIIFSEQPDESLSSEFLKDVLVELNHSIISNDILDKIQRTRIKDYSCLITNSFGLYFCYLFIGKSYVGSKKIGKFLEALKKRDDLLKKLETISSSRETLDFTDRIEVTKLVDKIFKDS